MGEIKGIMNVNVGIDIGSTTVKIVVVRDGEIIHKHYERHFSKVREKAVELVRAARGLIGDGHAAPLFDHRLGRFRRGEGRGY